MQFRKFLVRPYPFQLPVGEPGDILQGLSLRLAAEPDIAVKLKVAVAERNSSEIGKRESRTDFSGTALLQPHPVLDQPAALSDRQLRTYTKDTFGLELNARRHSEAWNLRFAGHVIAKAHLTSP